MKRTQLFGRTTVDLISQAESRAFVGFLDRLAEELERAERYERPFALLACILDGLDGFGARREEAVQQAHWLLESNLRNVDPIVRSGHAEFMALLPETGPEGATLVAERLRGRVERLRIVGRPEAPLTLSVGVATFPEGGRTVEELIRRAAQSVFRAWSQGGNRVVAAAPGPSYRWDGMGRAEKI